jgi:hypothetical protein
MTQKSDTEILELIRNLLEERPLITERRSAVQPLPRPVRVWKRRRSMRRRLPDA